MMIIQAFLLILYATLTHAQRETINFDFGWKFQLLNSSSSPLLDKERTVPYETSGFDSSLWELVDAPHDMLIEQKPDATKGDPKMGFYPRGAGLYQKEFRLPGEWKGTSVWVYIEGSFHKTNSWFNGQHLGEHVAGYTSFWLRLDDANPNWGGENNLTLHVDATSGTGWWYEGGGLMRHNYLISASPLHAAQNGKNKYSVIFKLCIWF